MKETFFYTVSVLLVLVAFAVFPMSLDAEPYGNSKKPKEDTATLHLYSYKHTAGGKISQVHQLYRDHCPADPVCDNDHFVVPPNHNLELTRLIMIFRSHDYGAIILPRMTIRITSINQRGWSGEAPIMINLILEPGTPTVIDKQISMKAQGGNTVILNIEGDQDFIESCETEITAIVLGHLYPVSQ